MPIFFIIDNKRWVLGLMFLIIGLAMLFIFYYVSPSVKKYYININHTSLQLIDLNLPKTRLDKVTTDNVNDIPFFNINIKDINQVYLKEHHDITKNKFTYELIILTTNGLHLAPFYPFLHIDDALKVEHEINTFLASIP